MAEGPFAVCAIPLLLPPVLVLLHHAVLGRLKFQGRNGAGFFLDET
jgi:hypothetical protein